LNGTEWSKIRKIKVEQNGRKLPRENEAKSEREKKNLMQEKTKFKILEHNEKQSNTKQNGNETK
jgi:hypothetical protein